jgi:WXG100 family type VII secretion target
MASQTVRADYDQLKSIQSQFRAQADAVARMNQDVKGRKETLEGGDWIGRGAKAFFQEMNGQVMPSLGRLQKALAEAARITGQIAQTMKQAEDDASACFHL